MPVNPLLLPVYGASTTLDNARYGAIRAKVERHVFTHHDGLMTEIATSPGPLLSQACDLARVPTPARIELYRRLKLDASLYRSSPDALVVALMVHGDN